MECGIDLNKASDTDFWDGSLAGAEEPAEK
jgi:hypothetical protein